MGNFSTALDYLEYAEDIAKTSAEFRQIFDVLKSAENIANVKFSNEIKVDRRLGQCDPIHENTDHDLHHDFANVNDPRDSHNKPQDVSSEVVANMFYQHATLGSNGEDYIFDDFVNLHHRLNLKLLQFDEKEASAISTQNHNNRNHNNHNHNHNKHTNNQTSQS